MRDDLQLQRSGTALEAPGRRDDATPGRRFARRLECADSDDALARRAAWPAARAHGSPRDGDDDPPDAA